MMFSELACRSAGGGVFPDCNYCCESRNNNNDELGIDCGDISAKSVVSAKQLGVHPPL